MCAHGATKTHLIPNIADQTTFKRTRAIVKIARQVQILQNSLDGKKTIMVMIDHHQLVAISVVTFFGSTSSKSFTNNDT